MADQTLLEDIYLLEILSAIFSHKIAKYNDAVINRANAIPISIQVITILITIDAVMQ